MGCQIGTTQLRFASSDKEICNALQRSILFSLHPATEENMRRCHRKRGFSLIIQYRPGWLEHRGTTTSKGLHIMTVNLKNSEPRQAKSSTKTKGSILVIPLVGCAYTAPTGIRHNATILDLPPVRVLHSARLKRHRESIKCSCTIQLHRCISRPGNILKAGGFFRLFRDVPTVRLVLFIFVSWWVVIFCHVKTCSVLLINW